MFRQPVLNGGPNISGEGSFIILALFKPVVSSFIVLPFFHVNSFFRKTNDKHIFVVARNPGLVIVELYVKGIHIAKFIFCGTIIMPYVGWLVLFLFLRS